MKLSRSIGRVPFNDHSGCGGDQLDHESRGGVLPTRITLALAQKTLSGPLAWNITQGHVVRTPLEMECCEMPLGQTAGNPNQTLNLKFKLTVGGWFT